MKKNILLHYITQFTGVLIIQVPIALRWISTDPGNVNYILKAQSCDTFTNLFINTIYIYLFNYLLKKKIRFSSITVIAFCLILVSPIYFHLISNGMKTLLWGFKSPVINQDVFIKITLSYFLGYAFYILIYFVTYYWPALILMGLLLAGSVTGALVLARREDVENDQRAN